MRQIRRSHPPIRTAATILLLALIVAAVASPARAQYFFGKNKVQYNEFDWLVLETEHFDIYFYEQEREIADIAAVSAEESYRVLSDRFNHHIPRRVPLIVYSSPIYFSETNVIPNLLPESVGGFTEFAKGRVVLPFHGSYFDFVTVLQHELVHVFQISKLLSVARQYRKLSMAQPPLWYTEGLAEYWSREPDAQAEMVMADLVLGGHFYNLDRIHAIAGTFTMYKEGEAFCHFLAERYGADVHLRIHDNLWRSRDFGEVLRFATGKSLTELGREWEYALKKKYFPRIADAEFPDQEAGTVTRRGFSANPIPITLSVDGDSSEWIIYKGNKLGYAGLYMMTGSGKTQRTVTLLKGERSSKFESLHMLRSDLDATPDGLIAFSSRRSSRDVLYILDATTRKIVDEYRVEDLVSIVSPSFSADGRRVVFAGAGADGLYDLYVLTLGDGKDLQRLTHDLYYDVDPVFTPDGDRIVFASDRGRHGIDGHFNLYACDLTGGAIEPLTAGPYRDRSPSFSPDGNDLIFTSNRMGQPDVVRLDTDGRLDRLTRLTTAAFDPHYTPDGSEIVFSAFQNGGFQIYRIDVPDSDTVETIPLPRPIAPAGDWYARAPTESAPSEGAVRYRTQLSLDIAQSQLAYDAVYGALGGFQLALTDMLGNHQYFMLLSNSATTKDDILKSFNVGLTYVNRENRINYGLGAFHLYDDVFDRRLGDFTERQYGGLVYVGYPISKFRRIETAAFIRQSDREFFITGVKREALLATGFVSFVHDNSLWDITGPIDGARASLSLGWTADLSEFRSFNRILILDARKYQRLGTASAFATRLYGHFSSGTEPQRRYFGGTWNLRGYGRRQFYSRNIWLLSNELRFPFINTLFVGSPIGALGFRAIRGAVFFDVGSAWEDDYDQTYGGFGVGARVGLGYLIVLRFDWTRKTDFRTIDNHTDFDFFFGWNF